MAVGWKKDYLRYKEFFLNVKRLYDTKPNLKIYLELALSIATVGIFAFFAIKPTVLTIIQLNKDITAKEDTSALLQQKVKNLQIASKLLQTKSEDIQYVEQAVPKTAVPEELVKQIEALTIENSLQITGLSLSDVFLIGKAVDKKVRTSEALAGDASELPFTLSATGSYQNIYLFISKLETLRRPIKIDSYTINSITIESGKRIVLSISGRVPYAE